MKRSRPYLIRPAARRDLKDIGLYTRRTWGRPQSVKYLSALNDKMCALAENPGIGVARDDVAEGYRSARVGHHHIFYRVGGDKITVVRILHESMDVTRHLDVEHDLDSDR